MNKIYTTKQAAKLLGISDSRIRQLALAGEIDHEYFGKAVLITEKGITQGLARNSKAGRPKKEQKAA